MRSMSGLSVEGNWVMPIDSSPAGLASAVALIAAARRGFASLRIGRQDSIAARPRGSARSQHLAGIEDAMRIEHRLEPMHQRDFFGGSRPGEVWPLLEADAVFGRDRAAALAQTAIDHRLDGVAGLGA